MKERRRVGEREGEGGDRSIFQIKEDYTNLLNLQSCVNCLPFPGTDTTTLELMTVACKWYKA